MAQSLSPCDLRPCDLGWKSADRSGIGCRADKNSLLIQHGVFDRPGIRESAEHSWSSLNNDSSLTGILEVKLFDVCLSPAASPPLLSPIRPLHHCFIVPSFPVLFLSPFCHSPLLWLLCLLPFTFLIISLSILLSPGLTATYYLLSVCSQAFAHNIPRTHLSYLFEIFSQLSSQFDPSANSCFGNNCVHKSLPPLIFIFSSWEQKKNLIINCLSRKAKGPGRASNTPQSAVSLNKRRKRKDTGCVLVNGTNHIFRNVLWPQAEKQKHKPRLLVLHMAN